MKEIITEKVEKVTIYEAIDGTLFKNKEECKKYENSAFGIINAKYQKLIIKRDKETCILNTGSEDIELEILNVASIEDADIIYQMLCYHFNKCDIKWYEKIKSIIDQDNNYFIVWYNTYDNHRGPMCTTQEIINNLLNFKSYD